MKQFTIAACLLFFSRAADQRKTRLWLVGDSTMSIKQTKAYPETGWGMPFVYFWDSTIVVDNRAQNGRSTKTFINEKRWQSVLDSLRTGDYVFVQFGHNDEVPTKASYTTPAEFTANLIRYVNEARAKGGIPILLTPVARRKFDSSGHVEGTHEAYSALVRQVAADNKVTLIDLDRKSQQLLQEWGEKRSALLFNHLSPGEHPNYPDGKEDNTHFNELGARVMAELVLKEIRQSIPELASHIITVPPAKN